MNIKSKLLYIVKYLHKQVLFILSSFFLFSFISCFTATEPPEYGLFNGISLLEIISPENEQVILEVNPNLKWKTIREEGDRLFPSEIAMIFDSEIIVNSNSNTPNISNKENILWMWDSSLPRGVPGEVNIEDFKKAVYNEETDSLEYEYNTDEPDPAQPSLVPNNTYYWIVVVYSSDGNMMMASEQYSFTYTD
ncbi:MAG: hypothetical protein ACOCV8_02925 [Spirochaetota bacterium]